jgi:REP element-mobilizing transposase RayT
MGYRHGGHTVFEAHLHLVWTTKYRKPVLTGELGCGFGKRSGESAERKRWTS